MKNMIVPVCLFVLCLGWLAKPAQAVIVANGETFIWGDPFGDQYDNYMEASPGDTIRLQIWTNDLHGSNWCCATDGSITGTWFDPTFIDVAGVHEDKFPVPASEEAETYYGQHWGWTGNNWSGANHWYKHYDGSTAKYTAEGKLIVYMEYKIQDDAPIGATTIGMEQAFYWSPNIFDGNGGYFFSDRIESDDPMAMTINVVLAAGACGIGDADCDGDVDLDDIIAAVGSFTGPCADGVDCFGDPGNGASIFNKTRLEGDVNNGTPVVGTLPLQSDGDVDLDDIIDMVGAFTGPLDSEEYAAASAGDAGLPDLVYDPATGEVFLDAADIGGTLQAYNIKNAGGGILNGNFTPILGGAPATDLSTEIGEFQLSATPTAPGGTSIGLVFPTGMDQAALEAFVTGGSAAPSFGGGSFEWELIALSSVPEPSTFVLGGLGLLGLALVGYRRRRAA